MIGSTSSISMLAAVLMAISSMLPLPVLADGPIAYPKNSYVLELNGLACPYCAYGLEKQFARQHGVTGVDIDIVKGVAVVHVRPGTRFTDTQLKRLVYDAGFALREVVHRPGGKRS